MTNIATKHYFVVIGNEEMNNENYYYQKFHNAYVIYENIKAENR